MCGCQGVGSQGGSSSPNNRISGQVGQHVGWCLPQTFCSISVTLFGSQGGSSSPNNRISGQVGQHVGWCLPQTFCSISVTLFSSHACFPCLKKQGESIPSVLCCVHVVWLKAPPLMKLCLWDQCVPFHLSTTDFTVEINKLYFLDLFRF